MFRMSSRLPGDDRNVEPRQRAVEGEAARRDRRSSAATLSGGRRRARVQFRRGNIEALGRLDELVEVVGRQERHVGGNHHGELAAGEA